MGSRIVELTRLSGARCRLDANEVGMILDGQGKDGVGCLVRLNGTDQAFPVRESFEQVAELVSRHWSDWLEPETVRNGTEIVPGSDEEMIELHGEAPPF